MRPALRQTLVVTGEIHREDTKARIFLKAPPILARPFLRAFVVQLYRDIADAAHCARAG
jgi:hypothetical protein